MLAAPGRHKPLNYASQQRPTDRLSATSGFWHPMDTLTRPDKNSKSSGLSGQAPWKVWSPDAYSSLVNANGWRRKRVLLTGHTGFRGSWLGLVAQRELGAQCHGRCGLDPDTEPEPVQPAANSRSGFAGHTTSQTFATSRGPDSHR